MPAMQRFIFDEVFWEADHRIGWLTYFSQPSLVEHLRDDPRSEPFREGIIVQLSDDPTDMMDDEFVRQGFEFAQSLVPILARATCELIR